jgi:hypothetical protein
MSMEGQVMKMEPQFISAPDGTRLVIITEAEYQALLEAQEDADDLAAALNGMRSVAEDGAVPAEVSRAIRSGTHPIMAWRQFRRLSQAQLADKANVTQAAIARLEGAPIGAGKIVTRRAIADAVGAPYYAFDAGMAASSI